MERNIGKNILDSIIQWIPDRSIWQIHKYHNIFDVTISCYEWVVYFDFIFTCVFRGIELECRRMAKWLRRCISLVTSSRGSSSIPSVIIFPSICIFTCYGLNHYAIKHLYINKWLIYPTDITVDQVFIFTIRKTSFISDKFKISPWDVSWGSLNDCSVDTINA